MRNQRPSFTSTASVLFLVALLLLVTDVATGAGIPSRHCTSPSSCFSPGVQNTLVSQQHAPTTLDAALEHKYCRKIKQTVQTARNDFTSINASWCHSHLTLPRGGSVAPISLRAGAVHSASERKTLNQVRLTFLFFYASLGSLFPYLPVYYHSLNLPGSWIGFLGAVNPLTTFLISPIWGAVADATGRHRSILLFTFAASLITRCSMVLSDRFWWLATAVFVTACLQAPVRPLLDSSVMTMLSDKSAYGKMRLYGQLGFGLGSSLVGLLISRKGFKYAFLVHALVSIPTFQIMRSFKVTSVPAATSKSGSSRSGPDFKAGLAHISRSPSALAFFFLVFVIGCSSGCIEVSKNIFLATNVAKNRKLPGHSNCSPPPNRTSHMSASASLAAPALTWDSAVSRPPPPVCPCSGTPGL